ncbi:glycerol-3-phosphate cytidylyltransferase [Desulfitobacterium hafniense]|uniref:Glycerol-3-phosphate cytidylyltransferase n=2 Tax=Desulfitobacterium hafniense TaxID=49338 RepID=A0A0W1JQB0_DESHA|nr:glycerol-3-phosphate cytidylyltransferase [Desulfitobacterium hafniense]
MGRVKQIKKYNVGYTTGVFDLFHIGHLNLLERCKEQCNHLIVAVCTDEYAHESGKHPIISYEDRARIIAALKCVNKVIPMTYTDKLKAWQENKFDVLFSGDDWKGSQRYAETERQFKEIGVDIVYFPYTKTVSTTMIRNKLRYGRLTVTKSAKS